MFGFKPIGDGLEPEQPGLSQGLPINPTLMRRGFWCSCMSAMKL